MQFVKEIARSSRAMTDCVILGLDPGIYSKEINYE